MTILHLTRFEPLTLELLLFAILLAVVVLVAVCRSGNMKAKFWMRNSGFSIEVDNQPHYGMHAKSPNKSSLSG